MSDLHRATFLEEAYEHLAALEASLLKLEEYPDDTEEVGRVFRALHTIKGSGAMFGFDDVATFTHEVETAFDLVRCGKLAVTPLLVTLTLEAGDHIRVLLDAESTGTAPDKALGDRIVAELRLLMPDAGLAEPPHILRENPIPTAEKIVTYRIRFTPRPEIFRNGINPVLLLNELRELGECVVVAHPCDSPMVEDIEADLCYTSWDVILTTDAGEDAVKGVFIFVEDDCDLSVEPIDAGDGGNLDYKRLGEILVERGEVTTEEVERVLDSRPKIGELLIDAGLVEERKVQAALVEQERVQELRRERQNKEAATSIRVSAEKLDDLVNLVGEQVTVQARLSQLAASLKNPALTLIAEEVDRLTADLRDTALNIRMLPIGTTFAKFRRLVRDLSGELGKEIDLVTEGEETELDKTVIEKLGDPLVHLIRNSIDHGVESPERRETVGKPRRGTIRLSAEHSGDSVVISITDDGAGLDREAILAKGIERGLVPNGAELSEREIFALIFAPGFSTAKAVTSVSGRGVGMDVVKQAIEALRGTIEIDSEQGKGAVITVKIPLTLAIIESLLVRIGDDRFMFPLSLVEECNFLTQEDLDRAHGRNFVNVRDRIVPFIRLREKFATAGSPPLLEQIVFVNVNGHKVGFVVDYIVGQHQTVIKSLGSAYRDVEGVSGATILGDGTVALILDVPHLLQSAEKGEVNGIQTV